MSSNPGVIVSPTRPARLTTFELRLSRILFIQQRSRINPLEPLRRRRPALCADRTDKIWRDKDVTAFLSQ